MISQWLHKGLTIYVIYLDSFGLVSFARLYLLRRLHPGRVESESPVALTTSRRKVLNARRSCASSLYTSTQSFLHRDSPSGERFQVGLDRGCPCLQLASSSSAPRTRWCGKEKVFDQLTFGTSCSMTKPAEPFLHEQCRYTCKTGTAMQFHRWHTVSAPYV